MQPFPTHRVRRGVTLLEVAVVFGLLGLVAAVSIPAVQSSRESGRQIQCQNNLRQVLLATQAFHSTQGSLPSLYHGTSLSYPLGEWDLFHMHSWRTRLLPQLEQPGLHDRIRWSSLATDPENLPIAQTVVPVYVCPSGADPASSMGWGLKYDAISVKSPEDPSFRYQVVRSDYDAMAGIQVLPVPFPEGQDPNSFQYVRWGVWGWPRFDNRAITGGRLLSYRAGRFRDIVDGLSQTIAVVERGGKPIEMMDGRAMITPFNPNADYPGQVGWSASTSFHWSINGSGVGVNHSNAKGIYSLHPSGAHVSMADGSVRFLSDSVDFQTLEKMFSRAGREP